MVLNTQKKGGKKSPFFVFTFLPLTTPVLGDKEKKKHNKRWEWFHLYLAKACYSEKEKQPLPSVFPLVFSVPQNYNVQIHKRIRCFCTLEINTTVRRECRCSAVAALKQRFFSVEEWVQAQAIVCLSVWLYSTAHSQPCH